MRHFVETHFEELKQLFTFSNNIPNNDNCQLLWGSIAPAQSLKVFYDFVQNLKDAVSKIINNERVRLYISAEDAQRLNETARAHWEVENQLY